MSYLIIAIIIDITAENSHTIPGMESVKMSYAIQKGEAKRAEYLRTLLTSFRLKMYELVMSAITGSISKSALGKANST